VTPCFTPGSTNIVADSCSRLFHLLDDNFLWHINHHYPVQPSWTLACQTPEMLSEMNFMLSKKLQPLALPTPAKMLTEPPGMYGPTSAQHSTVTQLWKTLMTPSPCCKSLHKDTVPVQWLPASLQSALEQWRAPFVPWGRRSPHWAARTHTSQQMENSTSDARDNSRPTKSRIYPHHASNQYRSQ